MNEFPSLLLTVKDSHQLLQHNLDKIDLQSIWNNPDPTLLKFLVNIESKILWSKLYSGNLVSRLLKLSPLTLQSILHSRSIQELALVLGSQQSSCILDAIENRDSDLQLLQKNEKWQIPFFTDAFTFLENQKRKEQNSFVLDVSQFFSLFLAAAQKTSLVFWELASRISDVLIIYYKNHSISEPEFFIAQVSVAIMSICSSICELQSQNPLIEIQESIINAAKSKLNFIPDIRNLKDLGNTEIFGNLSKQEKDKIFDLTNVAQFQIQCLDHFSEVPEAKHYICNNLSTLFSDAIYYGIRLVPNLIWSLLPKLFDAKPEISGVLLETNVKKAIYAQIRNGSSDQIADLLTFSIYCFSSQKQGIIFSVSSLLFPLAGQIGCLYLSRENEFKGCPNAIEAIEKFNEMSKSPNSDSEVFFREFKKHVGLEDNDENQKDQKGNQKDQKNNQKDQKNNQKDQKNNQKDQKTNQKTHRK